ncbi:carboxypeptidase-like regulatory domain-containing protein [Arcicella sp. DC2W]|uniref:Carboxypeptidase-like regulatory domain-containing protein n=1 Tax=Arcicella gelida TaxID=2984195 RepID=A0ABU5RZ27_9BACT|nr:carboxypeptidase-like regulatory domain-containing protein [Arcicella sp. DC2W]MEA5401488.1 carboxypeptidase-like regulatory domain-containing protein [Arcicella sp. DC2W]
MNKIFYQSVFLLLFISFASLSQVAIKGKVIDEENNKPLPFSTVFVVGSSIGTIANENGEFSLNVPFGTIQIGASFIGYSTISSVFESKQLIAKTLTFKLMPVSKELLEVKIEGKVSRQWLRDYRVFKREFLGESEKDEDYEIENRNKIRLFWEENTLFASCEEPLLIINRKLGYKVFSTLKEFQYKTNGDVSYLGITRFEVLKAPTEAEQNTWIKNRKEAYRGSPNHFFKSLIRHQLKENKFLVIKDTLVNYNINDFYQKLANKAFQINVDNMVEPDSVNHQYFLRLNTPIEIVYEGKNNQQANHRYRYLRFEHTNIDISNKNEVKYLTSQGELYPPQSLKFSGSMGNYRIGTALPSDYEPE